MQTKRNMKILKKSNIAIIFVSTTHTTQPLYLIVSFFDRRKDPLFIQFGNCIIKVNQRRYIVQQLRSWIVRVVSKDSNVSHFLFFCLFKYFVMSV